MQQHRIISLASILVMLIIPVIGWFLIAQPQLAAASSADEQRADMESQIEASSAVVAQLKADSAQLPKLNDLLNKLRTSIPAGVDSSGYIDGLDALAQYNGVAITALTVEEPTNYEPATPPVDPNAVVPEDAEASEEGETAPVAPPPVVDPAIVTNPLISSSNFVAVPVTITVAGEWSAILNFVDGLQSSPRLFLVTSLATGVVDGDPSRLNGNIGGYIYAIPTGVEGKPRPISTTVKSMTPPEPVVVEEDAEDEDAESDDTSTDEDTPTQ
jgi:Tfp pilus assembly protein PilO